MKFVTLEGQKYRVVKDEKNALELDVLENRYTDYFKSFDYVVGDFSYGKLRLKGFNEKGNPGFKPINDYEKIEKYIEEQCAYQCRYFILKKEKTEKRINRGC